MEEQYNGFGKDTNLSHVRSNLGIIELPQTQCTEEWYPAPLVAIEVYKYVAVCLYLVEDTLRGCIYQYINSCFQQMSELMGGIE